MKLKIKIGEKTLRQVERDSVGLLVDGRATTYSLQLLAPDRYLLHYGLHTYEIYSMENTGGEHLLYINSEQIATSAKSELDQLLERLGIGHVHTALHTEVKAPMPGKILDVRVKPGDVVAKGQTLLILEAMKMENVVKSATEATVSHVAVSVGQTVEKNQLLVSF